MQLLVVKFVYAHHHFVFQWNCVIKESYCFIFSGCCSMKITIHWAKFKFTWMPSLILFCGFLNILCEAVQLSHVINKCRLFACKVYIKY